jgi:hypothetical protein
MGCCLFSTPASRTVVYPLFRSHIAVRSVCLSTNHIDSINSSPNTPAGDFWSLQFGFTPTYSFSEETRLISFLPTGEIDMTHTSEMDLARVKSILAPTISYLQVATNNSSFDILPLLNWVFVSYYWVTLYDLGQIAPIYYNDTPAGYPDFTTPVLFPPINNIFVNSTLFQLYTTTLEKVVLPFLAPHINLPPLNFLPLDANNRLKPRSTSLLRSYSCQQRVRREWLSALVLFFAASYPFIVGGYHFLMWLVSLKKSDPDSSSFKE